MSLAMTGRYFHPTGRGPGGCRHLPESVKLRREIKHDG
jgi:hypothetical protein